jgi:hypothetical protein
MSTPGSTPGDPLSGATAALLAGLAAVAALLPVLLVLVDFARVRATPLRAAGFLSFPEREAAELNAVEFIAAAFDAAAFEAAEFEAAARWDAGSAAATDGLSKKSVFGRGAGIEPPSASPPLEPVPTITAACRIPTVRSRVLGDGARSIVRLCIVTAPIAHGDTRQRDYRTRPSAAAAAAPTMPASLRKAAATTGVRHSSRDNHLSAFLLTPPPAMIRSGHIRPSSTCR